MSSMKWEWEGTLNNAYDGEYGNWLGICLEKEWHDPIFSDKTAYKRWDKGLPPLALFEKLQNKKVRIIIEEL